MALPAKWQLMDRSVTHKIVYGPQLRFGPIYYFVSDIPVLLNMISPPDDLLDISTVMISSYSSLKCHIVRCHLSIIFYFSSQKKRR